MFHPWGRHWPATVSAGDLPARWGHSLRIIRRFPMNWRAGRAQRHATTRSRSRDNLLQRERGVADWAGNRRHRSIRPYGGTTLGVYSYLNCPRGSCRILSSVRKIICGNDISQNEAEKASNGNEKRPHLTKHSSLPMRCSGQGTGIFVPADLMIKPLSPRFEPGPEWSNPGTESGAPDPRRRGTSDSRLGRRSERRLHQSAQDQIGNDPGVFP